MRKLKNESEFQRFLRRSLSYHFLDPETNKPRSKFKKNHGNEYSEKGVSDVDGHALGWYIAIECKMWTGRPSTVQQAFLRSVESTGGIGLFSIYRYIGGNHKFFWVPGSMPFSYRMSRIWPQSTTRMVRSDPGDESSPMIEVADCSPLQTFIDMKER